jgi:hypothetical protein
MVARMIQMQGFLNAGAILEPGRHAAWYHEKT